MTVAEEVRAKGRRAKEASYVLGGLSTEVKDRALAAMAAALEARAGEILAANAQDMAAGEAAGLTRALLDRLFLNEQRIREMAEGLRALLALPDPIGEVTGMWRRPNGLLIGRMRVPLGVVGIIYEARPNVTVDAAGLCLKTGNAVLLRGGSEAIHSNTAITRVIAAAAEAEGIPAGAIQLIETTDREAVNVMLKMRDYLDLLIPRGGAGLIRTVVENATVPVIETGVGNCHVYVDSDASPEMATAIVVNAKTQRPGVCNAMETLLVHRDIAPSWLPAVSAALTAQGVELRGCPRSRALVPAMKEATEEDWGTEYLDLVLAVKVVDGLEEAIAHINTYGTKHSEAIVTNNYTHARRFLQQVDAASVYVN
ncbi:MAG: glutamate-5-semialdehyde dehydrogenase, partial [Clostridia bacterium]|nr:glutamate-5-semialdehyde dehydrogenase [Clostridia bacterium]